LPGDDHLLQFEDTTSRPDDLYRKRYAQEMVERLLDHLPERHREAFVLREAEGRTYQEIAAILRCNIGTVKSRIYKARKAFAAIIEPYLR